MQGLRAGLGFICLLAAATACAAPAINVDKSVATFDGLHPAESSVFQQVYVRDPLDLSGYTRVMSVSTPSQFRYLPKDSDQDDQIPLTDAQKRRFETRLNQLSAEHLGRGERYTLTDAPGDDVLTLWGTLVDVNAHLEADGTQSGEFILVVEVRDSMSEDTLVRIIHHARMPLQHDNPEHNQARLDEVIIQLATDIRTGLDRILGDAS